MNKMENEYSKHLLVAHKYRENFEPGTIHYSSVIKASDGKVYFVISYDRGGVDDKAQLYCLNPTDESIHHIADLGEVVGEKGKKIVGQGKVHVKFFEHDGKLYFATHMGYYASNSSVEALPEVLPVGYKPYPGGHILSYELGTGKFEDLAQAPVNQGFLALGIDRNHKKLYGLTCFTGFLFCYNLAKRTFTNLGPVYGKGEGGRGSEYERLCRTIAINPETGIVYWPKTTGEIGRYTPETNVVDVVAGCDLNLKIFGAFDTKGEVLAGNLWRTILWHPIEKVFYGIHGRSEYLFKFDPLNEKVEVIYPFRLRGGRGAFLGFVLGQDKETLYYLASGPGFKQGENKETLAMLHPVTYHIPSGKFIDHGAVRTDDNDYPTRSNSLVVSDDGIIYTVAFFDREGSKQGQVGETGGTREVNLISLKI